MEIINKVKFGIDFHLMDRISQEKETRVNTTATAVHQIVGAISAEAVLTHMGSHMLSATMISKDTNTTATPLTCTGIQILAMSSTTVIMRTTDMVRRITTIEIHS